MKLKNLNIYLFLSLIIVFSQSCSDMNDMHNEYLQGEHVYAEKVDSVKALAGNERIRFEMFISSQRIETMRIFWNNYQDSTQASIGQVADTVSVVLDNMEEKSYIFQFVSLDKFGNKSLPFEVKGIVYGSTFQSTILNRSIKSITPVIDGEVTIRWAGATDKTLNSEIKYINLNEEEATYRVPTDESVTVLNDFSSGLYYRTLFLPEETAIDTFYTDFDTIKVKGPPIHIPKEGWTATASSFDSRSGSKYRPPENAIDNDPSTIWANGPNDASYPHTLTVDMGQIIEGVEGISFILQQAKGTPKKVELFVSDNGENWNTMGFYSLKNEADIMQYKTFPGAQDIRYFRMVALEPSGNTGWILIPEIGAYTF